jgi:hypothetical protein
MKKTTSEGLNRVLDLSPAIAMERVLVVAVANSFNSASFKQKRRDSTLRSVAVIYVPVEIGLPTDCVMAAGPEI